MESHFHAGKQRTHIVRNRINVIPTECTKSQGQTEKCSQNTYACQCARHPGIKEIHSCPVQKVFIDIFFQIAGGTGSPPRLYTFDPQAVLIKGLLQNLFLKEFLIVFMIHP